MSRKNYLNTGTRQQYQKSKNGRNALFSVVRPVAEESAESLYQIMKNLKEDNILPETSVLHTPDRMHITYLERRKLTRELQGFAQGFNAHVAISRINSECEETRDLPITASLGRVSLMDRRNETLIARLDHNQIVADEYSFITSVLRGLHVHIRGTFSPHVSLARVPGETPEVKHRVANEVYDVIPDEPIILNPMIVSPPLQRKRG